jgi:hypothetical protein
LASIAASTSSLERPLASNFALTGRIYIKNRVSIIEY